MKVDQGYICWTKMVSLFEGITVRYKVAAYRVRLMSAFIFFRCRGSLEGELAIHRTTQYSYGRDCLASY